MKDKKMTIEEIETYLQYKEWQRLNEKVKKREQISKDEEKKMKKFLDIEVLRDKNIEISGNVTRPRNDAGFNLGDIIQITEKVDGSNASIKYDAATNSILAFSRKQDLSFNNTLNGFWNYAQMLDKEKFKDTPNYIIFGEWLYRQRSNKILYNEDMKNRWIVYDIYDENKGQWLRQDIVKEFCKQHNLEYINELYYGEFKGWEHCREFLHKQTYGNTQEGIVVKNQTQINNPDNRTPFVLKIVNVEFAESMIKHKNPVDPEKEKEKQHATELMAQVVTQNRVEKMLSKLKDEQIINYEIVPEKLGEIAKVLPKRVYEDIQKEEPEILKACGEYGGKVCGSITMSILRKIVCG